jgi:hypothetical protein
MLLTVGETRLLFITLGLAGACLNEPANPLPEGDNSSCAVGQLSVTSWNGDNNENVAGVFQPKWCAATS